MNTGFFSIDVEEYYHASVVERYIPRAQWLAQPKTMENAMAWLMDELDSSHTKATLFCLWEAVKHKPAMLRDWSNRGHEIASHTLTHRNLYSLNRRELKLELGQSKERLEQAIGEPVIGFRAPNFSMTKEAFQVLKESGYKYDSSLFPARTKLSPTSLFPYEHSPDFWEFPLSVWKHSGLSIPWSGGAYLRHFPWSVFKKGVHAIAKQRPYTLYLHPWDWDQQHPAVKGMKRLDSIRHNRNRNFAPERVKELLNTMEFSCMRDYLKQQT